MLSALNTGELSGQLARLRLARQIFVGEIYVVLIVGKLLLWKMPSKKKYPCNKATMLVTSFRLIKTPGFSFLFQCFVFSPLSTKVVYISLLCLACRLFSLHKGPVAEEGLIMWDAQFLLVQLPVVLREFCMGGCRCELKKMGRCWRNRRCCEWERKNWIVEHLLSCSKKQLLMKVLLCKKSVLSFVHMSVSIWCADWNDVENTVSFRKYPLKIMALTWNLFLFPVSLAELVRKALSILCYSHSEEGWCFALCFGFLWLCWIDYLLLFQEEVTIIVLIVFHLTLDWEE